MPQLTWIGKDAVVGHHDEVPYHLLRCDRDLSVGEVVGAGNLLVEGDNLLALKALLPYYGGNVQCIYIDPPYNTGTEGWAYNDNVNSPEMRQWLRRTVGRDDLSRHDKWLSMMYPRLRLLWDFLSEDGTIFVSIDDNELAHLLMLMREIFGPQNEIGTLVWEKGKKGDAKFFSTTHEYVVVFARNFEHLKRINAVWRRPKPGIDRVLAQYRSLCDQHGSDHHAIRADMMKWYRSLKKDDPAKKHKHYNRSDDRGLYFPDNFHGPDDGRDSRPRYDIIHPITGKACKKPRTGWRWEEERTRAALAADPPRIHFGEDETTIPCRKSYLVDVNEEPFQSVFYKDGRAASLQVKQMLGKKAFDFPKDVDILAKLLCMVTKPGDIILDSFAGSGTTGHAVLKLNAEDGGDRRFILVEMEPGVAKNVTAERLRLAIKGYIENGNEKGKHVEGLGGAFRYCVLGETLFDADGRVNGSLSSRDLAHHIFFAETGQPLSGFSEDSAPLVGEYDDTAYYLLWSGPNSNGVLDSIALRKLPPFDGGRVVYADNITVSPRRLKEAGVEGKQIPYRIKVR